MPNVPVLMAAILLPATLAAQTVRTLATFDVAPHAPIGGLVETADGSLYGTVAQTGEGSAIYRLPPGGGAATVVARFDRGNDPHEAMVRGPDGLLYGTTYGGGVDDRGTVFRFDPTTARITTLHAFDGPTDGSNPSGRLVFAPDGLIYGTTERGDGGTIFDLDPVTGRTRTRHTFAQSGPMGHTPAGGLVRIPDGALYGVLRNGGPAGASGTLYRFDPATGSVVLVYAFPESAGFEPASCPLLASDGWLYGTTLRGGFADAGTVYRVDPATGAFQTLHELRPITPTDGGRPFGRLVEGPGGSLFGTTLLSWTLHPGGSIFRLDPTAGGSRTFATIHHFVDPAVHGSGPMADLLLASDGRVYGTTERGGALGGGTIYRFDGNAGPLDPLQFEVVHAFSTHGPGWRPLTAPVPGPDGRLYGVTSAGGPNGGGEVYAFVPSTGATTAIGPVPFAPSFPDEPIRVSQLVDGGDGSLYGAAANILGISGVIYRVTPSTGAVTPAVALPLSGLGSFFLSRLVRTGAGLFGLINPATSLTLYRFDPAANTTTTVATIAAADPLQTGNAVHVAGPDGRFFVVFTTFRSATSSTPTHSLYVVDPATGAATPITAVPRLLPTPPLPLPDGSLVVSAENASGAPQLMVIGPGGAVTPGCAPVSQGGIVSIDLALDGSLFVVASALASRRGELHRCTIGSTAATLLHAWPMDAAVSGMVQHQGVFYGATHGGGPLGGGTIFGVSATGGQPPFVDHDGDGLDSAWESAFGLDASSGTGDDGPAADPDGDGASNASERDAGTHPRGFSVRYFAEGTTNAFFATTLALVNQALDPAQVLVRFLTDDGRRIPYPLVVPAASRRTIDVGQIDGLATGTFSVVVESDVALAVDRTMTWDASAYGSHAEAAIAAPATTWYFAEGSTSGEFALFYLLQNPQATPVVATVRYLRPFGLPPIERQYALPAQSRTTIPVDAADPALASTDVSAVITAASPIIAERAMYLSRPGQPFAAGHASAGVVAPALEWFVAEGATGPFFDLFVLLANPNPQPAAVAVDFLQAGGGVFTKTYTVPANGRETIWVDDVELPAGSGQKPLANAPVSTTVRSTNGVPVIVERTMWWPGPAITPAFWHEAHNAPGSTATAERWAIAGGAVGGVDHAETYVLIANTGAAGGRVLVRLLFENGNSTGRYYDVPPFSRTSVPVSLDMPEALHDGRFGVTVERVGTEPLSLVVERATYASPGGVVWARGSSALATPVP